MSARATPRFERSGGGNTPPLERYVRYAKRRVKMGEAIKKEDFKAWCREAAAWLLNKMEDAWRWVRKQLGLD